MRLAVLLLVLLALTGCAVPAATWLVAGTVAGAVFEGVGVTEAAATWYLARKGKQTVPATPPAPVKP